MKKTKKFLAGVVAFGALVVASPIAANASVTHGGVTSSVVVQEPYPGS